MNRLTNKALSNLMVRFFIVFKLAFGSESRHIRTLKNRVKNLMETMKSATEHAMESKKEKGEADTLLKGVKLSKEQQARKYLKDGAFLPSDSAYMTCVFCKHNSVDEMAENKGMEERNRKKSEEDRKKLKEFEKFKNNNGPPVINPNNGKAYKSKPQLSKMEKPMLVCHCHEFICASANTDWGSTCPFKCIKADGERYEWDNDKGGCQCPACLCECRKAYYKEDTFQIQRKVDELENFQFLSVENRQQKEDEDRNMVQNFINSAMNVGGNVRDAAQKSIDKRCSEGK